MRIALRTSGGRGEYEVAGSHHNLSVNNLFDRHISLEILPNIRMPTNNIVRHTQGKPRIRLWNATADSHIYLILAALLLLPKPKREIAATPGGKLQIYKYNYSVTSIPFDIVELSASDVSISPTDMILSNSDNESLKLDIIERFKIIISCWEEAAKRAGPIAAAILSHRDAFNSQDARALINASEIIRVSFFEHGDPLREITKALQLPYLEEIAWLGAHAIENESAMILGEENLEDLREAARNRIKIWKQVSMRGSSGYKFSQAVRRAYRDTCLFSGMMLPKTEDTGSSGVDAAHILPWARYDLNSIGNGICLSKTCHWAFDAGILVLKAEPGLSGYVLELSGAAKKAESAGLLKLGGLSELQGLIAPSLLPKDKSNWPNPSFLRVYNEALNP